MPSVAILSVERGKFLWEVCDFFLFNGIVLNKLDNFICSKVKSHYGKVQKALLLKHTIYNVLLFFYVYNDEMFFEKK